jgi:hypothetical protein
MLHSRQTIARLRHNPIGPSNGLDQECMKGGSKGDLPSAKQYATAPLQYQPVYGTMISV